MRLLRGLLSLLVLLAVIVGTPVVLWSTGVMVSPGRLVDPAVWLRPDDGLVLLTVVWCLAWVAWVAFVVVTVVEVVHGARPRPRRFLARPRAWVGGLVLAVLALAPASGPDADPAPRALISQGADGAEDAEPRGLPNTGAPGPMDEPPGCDHRVARGESLWVLAEQYFDDGSQWRRIADANPELTDPDALEIGQVLRIPGVRPLPEPEPVVTVSDAEPQTSGGPEHWPGGPGGPGLPGEPPGESDPDRTDRRPPPAPPEPKPAPAPAAFVEDASGLDGLAELGTLAIIGAQVGMLAATGMATLLRGRRDVQLALRPPGRRITHPPAEAVALGADADADRTAALDRILRAAGAHCHEVGQGVPALATVIVASTEVRLRFVAPPGGCPPWARAGAQAEWIVDADADIPDEPAINPWPALLCAGHGRAGEVYWDAEALPRTTLRGRDEPCAGFVHGLVLDALTSPWPDDLQVWVVGADQLVTLADVPHVATIDAAGLADLATIDPPEHTDPAERRSRRAAGEDAPPAGLIVFAHPPDEELGRLASTAAERLGLAVINVPGGREFTIAGPPDLSVLPDGTAVAARIIDDELADLVDSTFAATTGEHTEPASWWGAEPSEAEGGLPANVIRIHPDRTIPRHAPARRAYPESSVVSESVDVKQAGLVDDGPRVLLLGPVDLVGARGTPPTRSRRSCVEFAAWLVDHPAASSRYMARELLVAESTRRSTMSRLRHWLGRDPEGQPYLPEAYSGHISLSPEVSSDWQHLQLLLIGGVPRASTDALVAALELVRGAPLADAAPTQWQWAEGLRTDALSCIRDVGLEIAGRALHSGDIDLARWATSRALVAVGDDERLLCARLRTEVQAGNHAEVPRLALRLTRQARALDVDLAEETVAMLQEAMEGRVRGTAG